MNLIENWDIEGFDNEYMNLNSNFGNMSALTHFY